MRLVGVAWWLLAAVIAASVTLGPRAGEPLNSPIAVVEYVSFLVVFGLVAGLGKLTAHIAPQHGGSYTKWAYYGLLLPYIALPHVPLKQRRVPLPLSLAIAAAIVLLVVAVSFAPEAWTWLTSSADLGTRLRRECESVVREVHPEASGYDRERYIRDCINTRARVVR
jgi:hypothetical protein